MLTNQKGMSLTLMIALGFAVAVAVVAVIGMIVYFVKA